jgi:phosphate transport system protein
MTKHFHRDLERLHDSILSMSALVEEMIDQAGRCLCDPATDEFEELRERDEEIDRREVQIEEECLKMLALHQPVAIDLRRITTVMKANNDLERIADLAVNIAERAHCLHQYPAFPLPRKLERMLSMATEMVRVALNAFVDFDARAAQRVGRDDDQVDQLNEEVIQELLELMQDRPETVVPAMHCFSASRHIERIADHATNIAEDVVYLVNGEIVRHRYASEVTSQ